MKDVRHLRLALTLVASASCGGGKGDGPDAPVGDLDAPPSAVGCIDDASVTVSDTYEKRTVVNASARNAICNDGSPAVYYIRRGAGCGAKRWVIAFEGGGSCSTIAECQARPNKYKSSIGAGATQKVGGMMSSDPAVNPDFFSANIAFVNYCSSDYWMGTQPASAATDGLAFRGHDIVRAVIEDLEDTTLTGAPALSSVDEVLISGSSAGGLGVLGNVDAIAAGLPGKRVRAMVDAGWVADITAFAPAGQTGISTTAAFDAAFSYWRAVPDESCRDAAGGAAGRCGVGALVFPTLGVPLFVHEDLADSVQLNQLLVGATPAQATAYKAEFAANLRASFGVLSGVFAPNEGEHTIMFKAEFATRTVAGTTFRETLGNWYFERAGTKKAVAP